MRMRPMRYRYLPRMGRAISSVKAVAALPRAHCPDPARVLGPPSDTRAPSCLLSELAVWVGPAKDPVQSEKQEWPHEHDVEDAGPSPFDALDPFPRRPYRRIELVGSDADRRSTRQIDSADLLLSDLVPSEVADRQPKQQHGKGDPEK
jgi:hypothetical protein